MYFKPLLDSQLLVVVGICSAHDLGLSDLIEAVLLACQHDSFKERDGQLCALSQGGRRLDCWCQLSPGRTEDHGGHLPCCVSVSVS